MSNRFREVLKIYSGEEFISKASDESVALRQSAYAGDFCRAEPEELARLVCEAVHNLDEHHLTSILRDAKMSADAGFDMMYFPSYAVTAAGIYLMTHDPALLNESDRAALSCLMDAAFQNGIVHHSDDPDGVTYHIMIMLGIAGGQKLIEAHPDFCPAFTETVSRYLENCRQAAWEENPGGVFSTHRGSNNEFQNLKFRHVLAAWQSKPHVVFTYGTLMKGQRAKSLMDTAIWGGSCCLSGYAMYDLGRYPGIIEQSGETVLGEVWFVDDAILVELDQYEEEGSLYLRKEVTVSSAFGPLKANAYIYNHPPVGEVVRKKWGSDGKEHVWYAAYGSNLSAERFSCYIQGGLCKANGRSYPGCDDKALWTDTRFSSVRGRMYFGRISDSWGGGVAFFDPCGTGSTIVRLYHITREQLLGVMEQEGSAHDWYGQLYCLGVDTNGEPIYTLTSNMVHKHNPPSDAYFQLIRTALINEGGLAEKDADCYLNGCMY